MKKFFIGTKLITVLFVFWLAVLSIVEYFRGVFIPLRVGYLGPVPWANMDGVHYLRIASEGYYQYSEAFFPLYPLCIKYLSEFFSISPEITGQCLSIVTFFVALIIFYKLLIIENARHPVWVVTLLLFFPSSFFFRAVYSESLFVMFTVLAMYCVRKDKFLLGGICAAFAGATRLFGIFLSVFMLLEFLAKDKKRRTLVDVSGIIISTVGVCLYMYYLYTRAGDPFLFAHVQPAFGANRTGGQIILLPQVIWRYLKMITTAYMQPTVLSYAMTILEFISALYLGIVVWYSIKVHVRLSYIVFSILTVITPTFTGTLSSLPRYILSAVPLFMVFGFVQRRNMVFFLALCFLLQVLLCMIYLQGWFVA